MAFDPNKKAIPIGISDFKTFFDKDYYYVDKTLFIKDIIDSKAYVNLFTRPRRFGKTLNLSMIKYFFEKTEEGNSYLFKDLKIWKFGEKYIKHQGKYPVISLTFKGAKMNSWEYTYIELARAISEEYRRHIYLLNADIFETEEHKRIFADICSEKAQFSDYAASIKSLCRYLERYCGQKPILLIDEYDVPIQNSYICGFYNETINFIRAMLQDALKDNQYLELAIITGCLRVSKESIFTGLNNLNIYSILDKRYSERFGFTQEEVDDILKYYNLEEKREEIKEWYDGYQFGTKDIYNPWSILKYIDQLQDDINKYPEAYWVNTSGNDIVKKLVKNANKVTKNEIEILINGGTIEKTIHSNITYNELDDSIDNIWSMLFFTGYLTYTEARKEERTIYYRLKIPNEELLYIYENIVREWFKEIVNERDLKPLFNALILGEVEILTKEINNLLISTISYYDKMENFYHGFFLGILQNISGYKIKSNRESGNGRSDIVLIPSLRSKMAIIIEIKSCKKYKEMNHKLEEAIDQIENKKYSNELIDDGYDNILKYGIVFCDKECKIKKK